MMPDIVSSALGRIETFANLVLENGNLLIPQNDVHSLAPVVDMLPSDAQDTIGEFEQGGDIWRAFVLSKDFAVLTKSPEEYRVAVLMKNVSEPYALLCRQVYTLEREQLALHPVPPCMATADQPLLGLALYGEEVRYVSSARVLAHLLQGHAP